MFHLLQSLLNFLMFPMMFAAGATALGAGGADAGATTAAAGSDATAGGDAAADATAEGATSEADDLGGDSTATEGDGEVADEGGDAANPDALVASEVDGRMIPAKYKDIFKANRELQDIYVAHKFFKQEFPGGLKEARTLKQTVETYGGVEGVKSLKEESDYLSQLDKEFEASDPKMLDRFAELNKEATVDLIVHGIAKLKQFSPEQYNHTLGSIVFSTLANADALHDAFNVLQTMKDNPQAAEAAKALGQWYNSLRQLAEKAPEKNDAAKLSKLDQERKDFDKQKEDHANSQRIETVNNALRPEITSTISKTLAQEMKAVGKDAAKLKAANPKLYNRIVANVMQEIKARVMSDDTFKKNYETALFTEKNPQKAIAIAKAKNVKVSTQAVRDVWQEFAALVDKKAAPAGNANANAGKKTANAGSSDQGFKMVKEFPGGKNIDWSKSQHMVVDGKAILKTGEKVQWRI